MSEFDELKRASFDGIDFPWQKCSVRGGLRDHIHEFPHTPGGRPELLGRKLYEIDFDAIFMTTALDPAWKDLWPLQLAALRAKFENQVRSQLTIPTVGTIKAYCYDWSQLADPARMRSGETASLKFREDEAEGLLVTDVIQVSPAALQNQADQIVQLTVKAGEDPSVWDEMMSAVDDIQAVLDQGELYGRLIESKILSLAAILKQADRELEIFDDPLNHEILNALKTLWESTLDLAENVISAAGELQTYVVPHEMTTSDVAGNVYGDTSRGGDILSLNPIQDPFAIPAGTSLRYYKDAA